MPAATEIAPVVVSIEVARPAEEAFARFTNDLGEWWPTEGHSIGEDQVERLVVDARHGGTILERWHDGTEYSWATFTEWAPPKSFTMEWRPNPNPGPTTEVTVTFTPTPTGTLVELTHRGWERLGDEGGELRRNYEKGWPKVLTAYEGAAA
jgi:uncharacterized protein YndB with AHSA1/START domain